jgi:uncharacterized protein YukE
MSTKAPTREELAKAHANGDVFQEMDFLAGYDAAQSEMRAEMEKLKEDLRRLRNAISEIAEMSCCEKAKYPGCTACAAIDLMAHAQIPPSEIAQLKADQKKLVEALEMIAFNEAPIENVGATSKEVAKGALAAIKGNKA